jgi:hypothetical protein
LEEYAAECEEATGIAVPAFNCDNGTLVPTDNFDGQSCDRPNVLQHECDPGSRFQVLAKTQDAFVVAHCRKQGHPAGGYRYIAVIQYNRVNGATCWYQALTDDLPPQASAPIDGAGAGAGGGPGGTFPWLSPASTAAIGCVFCHDNGPIIRSPYLAQLHNVGPNPVTGFTDRLPGTSDNDDDFPRTGWNQSQPYTFPGNAFKTFGSSVTTSRSSRKGPASSSKWLHGAASARRRHRQDVRVPGPERVLTEPVELLDGETAAPR